MLTQNKMSKERLEKGQKIKGQRSQERHIEITLFQNSFIYPRELEAENSMANIQSSMFIRLLILITEPFFEVENFCT